MPGLIEPSEAWRAWPFDPASVLLLAFAAVAWEAAARRGPRPAGSAWWWAGLAVLAVALLTPLDEVAEELLSAHMVQHLLIGLVAPLLIVRAHPGRVLGRHVHPAVRRDVGRRVHPILRAATPLGLAVVAAHVVVWWAWHLPALYDLAVADSRVHLLEHASLFASGFALWAVAWPAGPVRQRGGAAVLVIFLAALGTGPLAAILTVANQPHYATDAAATSAWGMTRLADQQLAGAIMWVPGGFLYLAAGWRCSRRGSWGGRPGTRG
ncbi:MAG: cytochrome c oxidase assembly protein [Acidimicrobiales bacterium]